MASETEKGLPDWYALGGVNFNPAATKNIKWVAKLGGCTCGSPIVSHGRVFIGTQSESDDILLCLDEQTGRELGRFICRRPHRRSENWGVCSTPTVEGDRLYLVTPYGEAVCVNVASWMTSHATAGAEESDRHIVWKYDMTEKLHVEQHHTASCSPLVLGEFVYVCTGNGRFQAGERPLYPLTPSLIAFDKHTGQLVARDDEQIGEQLWRGQWSSPSAAMVNGKPQILFATGNGLCYGFEPADPTAQVAPDRWIAETLRGPIVCYIDVEGKATEGLTGQEYWTYTLKSDHGVLTSALLVADGKVFAGKSILAVSKTLNVLSTLKSNASTSCSTPCVANGVLFTVHGKRLWAVCDKGDKKPETSSDALVQ
jgi:hypothetical protein